MSFYTTSGGPPISEAMYNGGTQLGRALTFGSADNYAVSLVTNGTAAISIDTSQAVTFAGAVTFSGAVIYSGLLEIANGTAAAPSLCLANSTTTGLYRVAANSLGFSAAGVVAGLYGAAGNWALGSGVTVNTQALLQVKGANLSGTNGYSIFSDLAIPATITTGVEGVYSRSTTAASSFTSGYVIAFSAAAAVAGAGSTITRAIGLLTTTQNAGTNNASVCDNVAFSGNWYINSTDTNPSLLTGSVGVGAAAVASAKLSVTSTTKGFLPPVMTEVQRDAIGTPAEGLIIYNTTSHKLNVRVAAAWEAITSA